MAADKTDIWMPFYIGDYLADTIRLTTQQHGAYVLLLFDYWKTGPPPDDPAILQQITKLSPDDWKRNQPALMSFFTKERDGLLHQKRMDLEIAKRQRNQIGGRARAESAMRDGGKFTSQTPASPPAKHQRVVQPNDQPNVQQKPAIPQPQSQPQSEAKARAKDTHTRPAGRKGGAGAPASGDAASGDAVCESILRIWNDNCQPEFKKAEDTATRRNLILKSIKRNNLSADMVGTALQYLKTDGSTSSAITFDRLIDHDTIVTTLQRAALLHAPNYPNHERKLQ